MGSKMGKKTQNKESMWTWAHNTWINTEIIRSWFPILTNAGTFIHFIQWRTPYTLENCWTHAFFVLVLQKWKQSWSESLAQTNTCWKKRERMWVRGQGQRSRRHRSYKVDRSGLITCSLIKEAGSIWNVLDFIQSLIENVN